MRAGGAIEVARDEATGRSFLRSGRGDPPFSIRWCDGRVLVAASAAAPLGGDDLALDIDVGPGAIADVGTVASTIVLPGPTDAASSMTTSCRVADGAHLAWAGEPTVSVTGSDHVVVTTVDLAATASCRITEELVLGRTDERSGRIRLVIRVERDGAVLVHHDESFGPDEPGAGSVVSVGSARHVLSSVSVGVEAGDAAVVESDAGRAGWLPITDDAGVLLAVGANRPNVLALVDELARGGAPACRPRRRH